MKLPECTFTGVYVKDSSTIYIAGISDELAGEDIDHAVIFKKNPYGWSFCTLAESLAGLVFETNALEATAICIDGAIYSIGNDCKRVGYVDESDEGPSHLVHLKDACNINNNIIVSGMARRVYMGSSQQKWRAIDDGVFVPREYRQEPIGFLAIDGFDIDDIYACGLNGEIWHYNGISWSKCTSPTNLALTVMICNKDNNVYIGGLCGVLYYGNKNNWKEVVNVVTTNDFWGITKFKEEIYLSNYDGIFKIVNGSVELVFTAIKRKLTTAYISSSEDIIYSVGHKDILISKDGINWDEQLIEEIS